MGAIFTNIAEIFANSGWAQIFFAEGGWKYAVMIGVACVLLYLAIVHQFEPLLLLPIGFGMLMTMVSLIGIVLAFPAAFICRKLGLKQTDLYRSFGHAC